MIVDNQHRRFKQDFVVLSLEGQFVYVEGVRHSQRLVYVIGLERSRCGGAAGIGRVDAGLELALHSSIGIMIFLHHSLYGGTVDAAIEIDVKVIGPDGGEMNGDDLMDNYVTYMTDVFRSVRFGISNDQGVANMIRFYYFEEMGAFTRDKKSGKYRIDFDKMREAMIKLSEEILVIQGDGNYEAAKKLINEKGFIRDDLLNDLYKIQKQRIPKDIVFIQGLDQLGLTN